MGSLETAAMNGKTGLNCLSLSRPDWVLRPWGAGIAFSIEEQQIEPILGPPASWIGDPQILVRAGCIFACYLDSIGYVWGQAALASRANKEGWDFKDCVKGHCKTPLHKAPGVKMLEIQQKRQKKTKNAKLPVYCTFKNHSIPSLNPAHPNCLSLSL
jgi:hypothetical protein